MRKDECEATLSLYGILVHTFERTARKGREYCVTARGYNVLYGRTLEPDHIDYKSSLCNYKR